MLATTVCLVTTKREYRFEAKFFVRSGIQIKNLPHANPYYVALSDVQQRKATL